MTLTVAHFIDSRIAGGCEEVLLLLLSGLARRQTRTVLFHYDAPGIERIIKEARSMGVSCRTVNQITNRNLLNSLLRLAGQIRDEKPDIFHMHLNWPLGCRYATAAAALAGVSGIVATSHLFPSSKIGPMAQWKNRARTAFIDRYIAVSKDVGQLLKGQLLVPHSKIRIVRNGVQTSEFDVVADPSLRDALNQGTGRPIVFTPARLHKQKGHEHLFEAIAGFLSEPVIVLAGDGPERENLEHLSRKLGIADRVRFLGHRRDIPQLLACCDIFVLPSLYEGLPLSVLEAMAASKPVVATAIGGVDEAVLSGTTGLLVPPAAPQALAAAIGTLLRDKEMAGRMGEAARIRARMEFSSDAMVDGVMGVYGEIVEAPVHRGSSSPKLS